MKRDELLMKLGSSERRVALDAASSLIKDSLFATATEGNTVLPVQIQSVLGATADEDGIEVVVGGAKRLGQVKLHVDVVRGLAIHGERLAAIVLARALSLPEPDPSKPMRRLPSPRDIDLRQRQTAFSPRASDTLRRLRDGSDVALVGQSASGKTVCAAQVTVKAYHDGWTTAWLDLADSHLFLADAVAWLAGLPAGSKPGLLVVDNIQSNPSEAARLAAVLDGIRLRSDTRMRLLIVGWDSARPLVTTQFPTCVLVSCVGEDLILPVAREIAPKATEKDIEAVRNLSAGDLLIANLAFHHLASGGRPPSRSELAKTAFSHATGNTDVSKEARRVLYHLAALCQFEVQTAGSYATSLSHEGTGELLSIGALRRDGNFVVVGHRTLGQLIVWHMAQEYPHETASLHSPVRIAVNYLQGAEDRQILATLERLDLASMESQAQQGTVFLARAWASLQILTRYLEKQAKHDPSWGDNIASAVFAGVAFSQLSSEAWDKTASFVRNRWQISPKDLPEPVGKCSAERADFDGIRDTMRSEDATLAPHPAADYLTDSHDFDRFHRTWVVGLLLGFEGNARQADFSRLRTLKNLAAAIQAPDGYFYPARVPWVTARVVLGLAAAGETIHSSDTVRKAADWLRRTPPEGPCEFGVWRSGTGSWNSSLQTTAMCVAALVRAGVPTSDKSVRLGSAYLLSQRAQWTKAGDEIDGASAMETHQLVNPNWRRIYNELSVLMAWARQREPWITAGTSTSDPKDESSKIPYVAGALIGIIWETVKTELPLLLEGWAISTQGEIGHEEAGQKALVESAEDALDDIRAAVEENLRDRQGAVAHAAPSGMVAKELERWRLRQKTHRKLADDLGKARNGSGDLEGSIRAIDALGEQCLGAVWRPVEERKRLPDGA